MADTAKTAEKKPKNKITIKQRVILLVSCPLIVILLSSIAIVITVRNLEANGETEDTTAAPEVLFDAPAEYTSAPGEYCADMLKKAAKSDEIKVTSGTGVSFHDLGGDFSDDVFSILNNVTGQITDAAKSKYDSLFINYGESCEKLTEFAAVSSKVEEAAGEGKNNDLACTLSIPADSDGIAPFIAEDAKVYEECLSGCADSVEFTDESFVPDSVTAYYHFDAENERLTSFELVREYKFSANATFLGGLEAFGSGKLTLGCRVNTKYNITYAGISVQDELTLTKHGFQTLSMNANIADDALSAQDAASEGVTDPDRIFTVEFTSSDESVATVDETGMVEAVKVSDEPVTVTVKLSYRGRVYEDTCIVHVIEEDD